MLVMMVMRQDNEETLFKCRAASPEVLVVVVVFVGCLLSTPDS